MESDGARRKEKAQRLRHLDERLRCLAAGYMMQKYFPGGACFPLPVHDAPVIEFSTRLSFEHIIGNGVDLVGKGIELFYGCVYFFHVGTLAVYVGVDAHDAINDRIDGVVHGF